MTDKHTEALEMLLEAQHAEADTREISRNDELFLHVEDGQWEPGIVQIFDNYSRPRYTLDKCNPIVDSISGELEQTDFACKVRPSSNAATEDAAKILGGMTRSIENYSNAVDHIYMPAARKAVECGFDAWMIDTDWVDDSSFDQDLVIRKIPNPLDTVWFDPYSLKQDKHDADWCDVFTGLSRKEYEKRFPDGSMQSVTMSRHYETQTYKPDFIFISERFYLKDESFEIALMTDGSVLEVNDDFNKIQDELALKGITVNRSRKRKRKVLYRRLYDGNDWLSDAKKTVFNTINIVPVYGNFNVVENKIIYRGVVSKLKDQQRIYNYSQSRIVEEVALSPKNKMMMTKEQAKSHEKQIRTMNTNNDPVQFYNHVEGQPMPFMMGGSQVNPSLLQLSDSMKNDLIESSGVFAANQGNAPNQSGIAIELQQNKGDASTLKYFKALKIAITRTCQLLVDAIPKVYDTPRQVRMLGQDGTSSMEDLYKIEIDQQTGEQVVVNDLRAGKYDVVCDMGQAFKNRQQQTVKAFTEISAVDPSIVQEGADILLNNIPLPGMDQMAERKRQQLLEAGMIPDSQMTEKEKEEMEQLLAQMNQPAEPPGPTPIEEATLAQVQANIADTQSKVSEREGNLQLKLRQQMMNEQKFMAEQAGKQEAQDADVLNTHADTLKKLKDSTGADVIINPNTARAYDNQSELIVEDQSAL